MGDRIEVGAEMMHGLRVQQKKEKERKNYRHKNGKIKWQKTQIFVLHLQC